MLTYTMMGGKGLVTILGAYSRLEIARLMAPVVQSPGRYFSVRSVLPPTTLQCPAIRSNQPCLGALIQVNHLSTSKPWADKDKKFQADVAANLKTITEEKYDRKVAHPERLVHFRAPKTAAVKLDSKGEPIIGSTALPHPIWDEKAVTDVHITHMEPKNIVDRLALASVTILRRFYDIISGYNTKPRTEDLWLNRIIFLETVAGVPGMVAAMVRHLQSLRRMRRDHGWIHTLLEEAENERMHLMTAMQLKQPPFYFRWAVIFTQATFVGAFSVAYMISPHYCHRFVGYLEEEAVVTYSKLLQDIDDGKLMNHWATFPAPSVAVSYWQLPPKASMRDVILAIRADEAHHRVVNHTLGSMRRDDYNPYKPGE